jgi:hypothetical protein
MPAEKPAKVSFYHVGMEAVATGEYTGDKRITAGIVYLAIRWYDHHMRCHLLHYTSEKNILVMEK